MPAALSSVLVVTLPFSNVNVVGEVVFSNFGIVNLLNRRLFVSRIARSASCLNGMNIDGTPEKTPPASRKKIRGIEYGGEHRWMARDKTVIATEVKSWKWTSRSKPHELDVDIKQIALTARGEKATTAFPNAQAKNK